MTDDECLVQAFARHREAAFMAGARAMQEAVEAKARAYREHWSCAGGFGGHSAAARILADEISAIDPASLQGLCRWPGEGFKDFNDELMGKRMEGLE